MGKNIVGAIHKNAMQDFVTNLQLQMLNHIFEGESKLSDLPDAQENREILAETLKMMKKEGYTPMIKGDMVIFIDNENEVTPFARKVGADVLLTDEEIAGETEGMTPTESLASA